MTRDEFNNLVEVKYEDGIFLHCNHCNKLFLKKYKYIKISFRRNPSPKFFCTRKCVNEGSKFLKREQTCRNCNVSYIGRKNTKCKNTFCSQRCAAIFNNALRNSTRIYKPRKYYPYKPKLKNKIARVKECLMCKNELSITGDAKYCLPCRQIAFQRGGLKSVESQSQIRRSKNEILFAEICSKQFKLKTNYPLFNGWDADIILTDYKIAILWNGKWHYEQIGRSSLSQIQNRDSIKIREILKMGYYPYIVKDMGKHNPEFVSSQFQLLLSYLRGLDAIQEMTP